jgi:hypothetical protein
VPSESIVTGLNALALTAIGVFIPPSFWGSGTSVGLYHVTVSPALIVTFRGRNIFHGAVALPPMLTAVEVDGVAGLAAVGVIGTLRLRHKQYGSSCTHKSKKTIGSLKKSCDTSLVISYLDLLSFIC